MSRSYLCKIKNNIVQKISMQLCPNDGEQSHYWWCLIKTICISRQQSVYVYIFINFCFYTWGVDEHLRTENKFTRAPTGMKLKFPVSLSQISIRKKNSHNFSYGSYNKMLGMDFFLKKYQLWKSSFVQPTTTPLLFSVWLTNGIA